MTLCSQRLGGLESGLFDLHGTAPKNEAGCSSYPRWAEHTVTPGLCWSKSQHMFAKAYRSLGSPIDCDIQALLLWWILQGFLKQGSCWWCHRLPKKIVSCWGQWWQIPSWRDHMHVLGRVSAVPAESLSWPPGQSSISDAGQDQGPSIQCL